MFRKYRSVISPISDATKTQNNIIIFFLCAMKGYKTAFLKLFFILVSTMSVPRRNYGILIANAIR